MSRILLAPAAAVLLFAASLCAAATATAGSASAAAPPAAVTQVLEKLLPEQRPDEVRAAPLDGFYEARYGADIFYISADGRYALHGDIVDLGQEVNLTENRRAEIRKGLLGKLDGESAIVFAPHGKARHVVYVFTDVDCAYCRHLHSEIAQYNARGIEIRYLAFPRSGVDTPSYDTMVSVWCSADRQAALTRAKLGQKIKPASCDNPVREQMALGEQFGVSGTPTLILPDGSALPGYVPPAQLAAYLDEQFGGR
jgi:thiol:disulfide interchange protein DsbC